jgi:hypothetical protein
METVLAQLTKSSMEMKTDVCHVMDQTKFQMLPKLVVPHALEDLFQMLLEMVVSSVLETKLLTIAIANVSLVLVTEFLTMIILTVFVLPMALKTAQETVFFVSNLSEDNLPLMVNLANASTQMK